MLFPWRRWPLLSLVPWKCVAVPFWVFVLVVPSLQNARFQQTLDRAGFHSPLRVSAQMSPSQLSSLTTNTKAVVHHSLSPCQYPLIFFMTLITMWNHINYLLTYLRLVSFILLTTSPPRTWTVCGLHGYLTDTCWMNKGNEGARVTLKYHYLLVAKGGKYAGVGNGRDCSFKKRILFIAHKGRSRQVSFPQDT